MTCSTTYQSHTSIFTSCNLQPIICKTTSFLQETKISSSRKPQTFHSNFQINGKSEKYHTHEENFFTEAKHRRTWNEENEMNAHNRLLAFTELLLAGSSYIGKRWNYWKCANNRAVVNSWVIWLRRMKSLPTNCRHDSAVYLGNDNRHPTLGKHSFRWNIRENDNNKQLKGLNFIIMMLFFIIKGFGNGWSVIIYVSFLENCVLRN